MENNKIYTGFGDKGYTSTVKNMHISKSDTLIELLGTLDEFTSALGAAKCFVSDRELIHDIELVQRKIIEINGEIAGGAVSVTEDCISAVERMIDRYRPETASFDGFVIPGGSRAGALLDMARTICRRAERIAVKAGQFGRLRGVLLIYLNRLSDLIYVFARHAEKDVHTAAPTKDSSVADAAPGGAVLTLTIAKELAQAIEEYASSLHLNIVVAVLDAGANLILLHSMDNAYIASCKIAQDKAYTAVSLKMSTKTALDESRGGALDGLSATTGNGLLLLGGGMPLKMYGQIVGGLGVSGGTAEQDTEFANYGARYLEGRFH